MTRSSTPHIMCYLSRDQSAHEGSGGGFTVVRFFHLVVENHTPLMLHSVKAPYRLMKGEECFQEDELCVERIAPGETVRSQMFIRDSAVFDRIEWVGNVAVEADQEIPRDWISFNKALPRTHGSGCLMYLALLAIIAAALAYFFIFRG